MKPGLGTVLIGEEIVKTLIQSGYALAFAAAGVLAGLAAWMIGPAGALAMVTGLGVAGGLLFTQWLRMRHRWIGTEIAQLRWRATVDDALRRQVDATRRDLAGWQQCWRNELESLRKQLATMERRNAVAWRKEAAQLQALLNLHAMLPVRHRLPSMDGVWTVSPDFMLLLASLVQERRPGTIVELGSGASTVWTALLLHELAIDSRMVSIDHDASYAEITRERLTALGLEKVVDLRHAPLVDLELDGEIYPWYDRAAFADIDSCDLLVVDGPPGILRPESRYPALPVLGDRMGPGSLVLMDDLIREDEQHILARWVGQQPGWRVRELKLAKGAALLTRVG